MSRPYTLLNEVRHLEENGLVAEGAVTPCLVEGAGQGVCLEGLALFSFTCDAAREDWETHEVLYSRIAQMVWKVRRFKNYCLRPACGARLGLVGTMP